MTQLPKTILLDLTHQTILEQVRTIQLDRNLTNCEMELILTQVLNDIKTAKEQDYAETILDLVCQLQDKEKEPVMEPIKKENSKDMEITDVHMDVDKIEFTPENIEQE